MRFTKNDESLHAERILIREMKLGSPHSRKTSTKLNNYRQNVERKNSTSIVSFFNITTAKSLQKQTHQKKENKNNQQTIVVQQEQHYLSKNQQIPLNNKQPIINSKKPHKIEQDIASFSQIGSEYGDYNYDNELHQVLKRTKPSPRHQLQKQSKIIFRIATSQNQASKSSQYNHQRFQKKFKTQVNQDNSNVYRKQGKQQSDWIQNKNVQNNIESKKVMLLQIQQKKRRQDISRQQMTISKFNIPQQLQKYHNTRFSTEPVIEQTNQSPLKNENIVFGNFLQIVNKKLQPNQSKKGVQSSPSMQRRIQREKNTLSDTEGKQARSEQIFQNYKKLKQTFRKISSTYKQRLQTNNNNRRLQASNNDHSPEHSPQPKILRQQQNSPSNKKFCFNSMPKNKRSVIFQDIYARHQFLTTRAYLTPRNSSNGRVTEMAMRKLIQDRQKDFFQQTLCNMKRVQSPAFTFEQIRSKLAKMQQLQHTARHNKSLTVIRGAVNEILPKDLIRMSKSNQQMQSLKRKQQKQKKSKGNHGMKSNSLMKKHNEFYQGHMKKQQMEMQQFSKYLKGSTQSRAN